MNNPEIRFVENADIDCQKWDDCLQNSDNSRVYALSWYLDIVCPGWSGLVMGDYQYVMPMVVKQKFGIAFLLQPIFAQQHGIFPEPSESIQNAFLRYVGNRFKYININLNSSHITPFPEKFDVAIKQNFILSLAPQYDELIRNYSKHTRRQIKKADDCKVFVVKGLSSVDYLNLKNMANNNSLPKQSMRTLQQLIEFGHSHGNGMIYAAYNEMNTLCAAAFFLIDGQRAIYLSAVSSDEGKNTSAMHKIIDQFIHDYSGSSLILDFEGSMIGGIARLYAGFGSEPERYYCLKMNKLPVPIRWFKK